MKLSKLVQSEVGVPFYTLKKGTFFEIITFDSYGKVERRSERIYEMKPIFMKIDGYGALDYPYNQLDHTSSYFIGEKTIVRVIKKSQREYRDYIYGRQILMTQLG